MRLESNTKGSQTGDRLKFHEFATEISSRPQKPIMAENINNPGTKKLC
jgi:hypothetical protein